jgi:RNA polymerase sigma-70 factor, ECF subfamily
LSDRELLDRIRRGDQAAFEELFRTHYAALVGFAEGMVRRRDVAEEVVQEVLLNLWRRRETLQLEDSLRAYLYQSARNRALNHLRHERVVRDAAPRIVGEDSVAAAGAAALEEAEIAAAVRQAVSELPERCREVFELSRTEGLRYAEIARVLGISVKTVETQMGRALKALRVKLGPYMR